MTTKKNGAGLGAAAPKPSEDSKNTRTRPDATRRTATVSLAESAEQATRSAAVLISQGWSVLPLKPLSKKPIGALVPHGLRDATQDLAVVEGWFAVHPTANLGAVPPVGCYVLDLDVYKNSRLESLALRLAGLHTPMQRSGGGGQHFVIRGVPPSQAELRKVHGEGIDVKAHGKGYIAVAPSVHPETGAFYEWGNSPQIKPADAPDWLLEEAPVPDRDDGDMLAPPKVQQLASPDAAPISGLTLDVARDALRHLPPSMLDEYDSWLRIGFALHAQFAGADEALALWDTCSHSSPKYEPGACAAKWATMRDDKAANVTMRSVLQEARRYGWRGSSPAVPSSTSALRLHNPLVELPHRIRYVLGPPVLLPDLPEQVSFFGRSESFKSVVVQGLCVHMAAGVALDGKAVAPRVVVYAAEEAPFLFDNNLHAWWQHFAKSLNPAVRAHAVRNLEAGYLQRIEGNVGGLDEKRAEEIAQLILTLQRALHSDLRPIVVLDPLAEVMQGDESKAEDMRRYIAAGRKLQQRTGALLMHVHHTGHNETGRERGSSTFPAAMFVRFEVRRPDPNGYTVELHPQKHKRDKHRMSTSRWEVRPIEVLPPSTDDGAETGVVIQHLGDAVPHVSQAEIKADHQRQQLLVLLAAYRHTPDVGGKRLRELLSCGDSTVRKLQLQAVQRGLLQAGGGSGRAGHSITDAGREFVGTTPPPEDSEVDDLLG